MTESRPTVLVYLKHPTAGRVKTRLAARIGAEAAARLYRGWVGQVLDQLAPLRPEFCLVGAITGAEPAAFSAWADRVDEWWCQPEGDLGQRLSAGFAYAFATGRPVIAVGTDCLEIDADTIRLAVAALATADAVFGPAADGGYYLVGTARPLPGFFDDIRWSGPQTLTDHLCRCLSHGWRYHLLPRRSDIDTWEDWQAYLARTGRLRKYGRPGGNG